MSLSGASGDVQYEDAKQSEVDYHPTSILSFILSFPAEYMTVNTNGISS